MKSAAVRLATAHREQLSSFAAPDKSRLRAAVLLELSRYLCGQTGLDPRMLESSHLERLSRGASSSAALGNIFSEYVSLSEEDPASTRLDAARLLGRTLDLLQASEVTRERKTTGSYFTPNEVAEHLIVQSLQQESLARAVREGITVCDPACGGGAFLVEAAARLSHMGTPISDVVERCYGIDLSEVALATTQVALWLLTGDSKRAVDAPDRFVCGDALWGRDFIASSVEDDDLLKVEENRRLDFPRVFPSLLPDGFGWIVGNPPWVAFQGRATQKISPERRAFYRKHYEAFSGYPTLHGMFVQRAASLAPRGHISLLLPSSLSDLDGYKKTRASLRRAHTAARQLPEYGQDAFEGVVQPCFGLIAAPGADPTPHSERPWTLQEKSHRRVEVVRAEPPAVLGTFDEAPVLPKETFREVGFQSNRIVVAELFYRGHEPPAEFSVPLLEGRNVGEFVERPPRLFLKPDEETLRLANVRLKDKEVYEGVDVVVRQTAAFTIAARHQGERFRNSLIGAFGSDELSADLLVGLLNSALFRALHVSRQRDARQAAFPQVKLSHLRRLPAPPESEQRRAKIAQLSAVASAEKQLPVQQRKDLDGAVFDLFEVPPEARLTIVAFLRSRAPAAAPRHD